MTNASATCAKTSAWIVCRTRNTSVKNPYQDVDNVGCASRLSLARASSSAVIGPTYAVVLTRLSRRNRTPDSTARDFDAISVSAFAAAAARRNAASIASASVSRSGERIARSAGPCATDDRIVAVVVVPSRGFSSWRRHKDGPKVPRPIEVSSPSKTFVATRFAFRLRLRLARAASASATLDSCSCRVSE